MSLTDVFATLQSMLAYDYVNDFNLYGKTYHVQVEAQAPFRQRPEDIGKFYVRSSAGQMVPLSSLVRNIIPSRADRRHAIQWVHVRAGHWNAGARQELRRDAGGHGKTGQGQIRGA